MSIIDSAKTPLYLELYRKLRVQIESGEYEVGSKIPTEKEISEQNGVSRITSKHALEQLVNEGYIKRFPGKGSFVQSRTGTAAQMQFSAAQTGEASRKLIGVVVEGISSNFGGEVLLGIERKCAERGYSAVIKCSYGDEERETACIDELVAVGVQGIVMMCVYSEVYSASVMKLSLAGFPMVFMDRRLKGLPVPFVGTDHYSAAMEMTDELVRMGHKNMTIAMFEESCSTSSAEERVNGYMDSCLKNDLFCGCKRLMLEREGIVHVDPDMHVRNVQLVRDYLKEESDITAIIAMSSRVALILLGAVAGTGVQVIASFDGPQNTFQTSCKLVYIAQDQLLMGGTACNLLLDKIEGQDVPHITFVPYQLNQ